MYECTLCEAGLVRNARVDVSITPKSDPNGFHAALLLRKNGIQCIAIGLGGWGSYFSVFHRTNSGGLIYVPRDSSDRIRKGQIYHFSAVLRSGFLTDLSLNGETVFPTPISLRDSLQCSLHFGSVGLYAYGLTRAEVQFSVEKLPSRCFVVTNIDGPGGKDTDARRRRLGRLLKPLNVEISDSRDLTRDHPLMKKIHTAIAEADFVIVDFGLGEPRGNVYYEAGIAHSCGVPTVHIGPASERFGDLVPSDLKAQEQAPLHQAAQ